MRGIIKIIFTDSLSCILLIIPLVLVAMGTIPFFTGDLTFKRSFSRTGTLTTESSSFYFTFALVVAPFVLFFLIQRIVLIKGILEKDMQVTGTVQEVSFTKDRGYVQYQYTVNGVPFKTTNRIMKTEITRKLIIGKPVTVCYDASNPKHAFIREIYT